MKNIYLFLILFTCFILNGQNNVTIEKKLLFGYNEFNLSQNAISSLDSLVNICNNYSIYSIKIVGYTDSSGSVKYNQKLSNDRSKAVFDYLSHKKLNQKFISHQGSGIDTKSENEIIQRNTTVTFTAKSEDSYYRLNSRTASNGSKVSFRLKNECKAEFSIQEYFSTANMLTNEKFALDINDEVLETAGMIDIDLLKINPNDIEDGKITVSIPTISNADYDEEMTVWIEETDKNGSKRWRNLKLKPKWNKDSKRYEFDLNVSKFKSNQISINLDKNIYREQAKKVSTGKNKKVIIVSTENEEFFYDVYLSYRSEKENDLKFSAQMDKTGFAFVIPKNVNPKTLHFTGINSSGKKTFGLSSCKVSKYNKKYPLYKYIPNHSAEKTDYETTKMRGFWQWIKRIFT